jgi:endo-1,4-beta-xylanase
MSFRAFAIGVVGCVAAAGAGCGGGMRPPPGSTGTAGSGGGGIGGGPVPHGDLRRAAAAAGKRIGAAVDVTALHGDATYRETLAAEFDYVTPENATKWGVLAPAPGVYDWAGADATVAAAEAQGQAVKGHTLIWHQQAPAWLTTTMTAEQIGAAMKQHIEATLARYRGRMRAWDVVNEAVDTSTASGYRESLFWQKLGAQYIEDAFRWARAADPDVLLLYNDFGIERLGAKADFTYALMRDLLAKGTPIDGIGFQSHVSIHRYPADADLRANLRRFAELGLRVNISELDARTLMLPGSQTERWQAQRIAFQQVVGVCVLEPACEGVTLWGFTDRYSWINNDGDPDDPLPFDRNYARKPAYTGVLDGLAGTLPKPGDNVVRNGDFSGGADGWAASGGTLVVETGDGGAGAAACAGARTETRHGLIQTGLYERLSAGAFSVAARARLRGATSASVVAELIVHEATGDRTVNLTSRIAGDGDWVQLAGYVSLGFATAPAGVDLQISGPPAGVELCVADVELRPLSPR